MNARRDREGVRWIATDEQGTELWVSDGGGMSGLTRDELESLRGPTRVESEGERLVGLAEAVIAAQRIFEATRPKNGAALDIGRQAVVKAIDEFRAAATPEAVAHLAREMRAAGYENGYRACREVMDD